MRYLIFRSFRYLLCAAFVLGAPWATAGFIGNQIGATYFAPNLSSPNPSGITVNPASFTVGNGVETTVTYPQAPLARSSFTVNFSDTNLTLTFSSIGFFGLPSNVPVTLPNNLFHGMVFTLVSGDPWDIASFSVASNVNSLGNFSLAHDAGHLYLNLSNLNFIHNQFLSIDFLFADPVQIPEPAPLTLLALGLLGYLAIRRRMWRV